MINIIKFYKKYNEFNKVLDIIKRAKLVSETEKKKCEKYSKSNYERKYNARKLAYHKGVINSLDGVLKLFNNIFK